MKEATILAQGGVGVIPTDTLYGVVASALHENAVQRVYELKGRTPSKPCIILISSFEALTQFGISLTEKQKTMLSKYMPGPTSVILPCDITVPDYLHRGTRSLAFRIPKGVALQQFLKVSGPLIAPSANPEGLPPATTIEEAKNYFGSNVDFYQDGGTRIGKPSTIITFDEHGALVVVRGALNPPKASLW